jgi:transglutaminase-like putative cysteine protease
LGAGPELSEELAMTVNVDAMPPTRFYWRATSYDEYTGRGWLSNADSVHGETPWPEATDPPPNFALLRQSFRLPSPSHLIYAAGRPVQSTQPARGQWLGDHPEELIAAQSTIAVSAYEVLAWYSIAAPDDLRASSTDYPEWIAGAYLALPDSLPERVGDLAEAITAGQPTPYDRALALQNHLRTHAYSLDLAAPPDDRDVVDYFLFETGEGYCDYFASAMVVMARSVGIPARLAVGYATGTYDEETGSYYVTEADAHSWAEIYFPDYGWIPFEPTAARPAPDDPLPAGYWEPLPVREGEGTAEAEAAPSRVNPRILWPLLVIPAAPIAALGAARLISALRLRQLRRRTPGEIITSLYRMLLSRGQRLRLPPSPTQTPHEFLDALRGELQQRTESVPRWGGDWPARLGHAAQAAGSIITLYADDRYSPRGVTRPDANAALDGWPALSRALWWYWLAGRWGPYRRGGE